MITVIMASAINVCKGDCNDGDNSNEVYHKCANDNTGMEGKNNVK